MTNRPPFFKIFSNLINIRVQFRVNCFFALMVSVKF